MSASFKGGRASIDFVINKANEIYKKWIDEDKSIDDVDITEESFKRYLKEYSDFGTVYPLTLRYMIQAKWYSPKAFRKFLLYIQANPLKGRKDFLESQVVYATMLYKETTPKYNTTDAAAFTRQARKELMGDWDKIDKIRESCVEEAKRTESIRMGIMRKNLIAQLHRQKHESL
jgi:hypothetical protein